MSKESMDHKVAITYVSNPKYPFLVNCNCAWQAHAKTQDQANIYKRHHEAMALWLKASKGYQVGHA